MTRNFQKRSADTLYHMPISLDHPADTYLHFSFASYHNPDRMQFGALRVFNDDTIIPHGGLDRHTHRDMEIVTYIISGRLTHWNSITNTTEILCAGGVKTMTAGTGIWHSVSNQQDEACHLLQLWILPPAQGRPPRYQTFKPEPSARQNKLLHIIGNLLNWEKVPLHLDQDINIYVSELTSPETPIPFSLAEGRQAYINTFEGSVNIQGITRLNTQDSLEITGPAELEFTLAAPTAHFIIIEMSQKKP